MKLSSSCISGKSFERKSLQSYVHQQTNTQYELHEASTMHDKEFSSWVWFSHVLFTHGQYNTSVPTIQQLKEAGCETLRIWTGLHVATESLVLTM